MICREELLNKVKKQFNVHNIVCLLGPRQCGKTTLAKEILPSFAEVHYFDLEKPTDLQALETPELALSSLSGLIVIDEIQRCPDLFPYLRYLHDEKLNQKFLILGSASKEIIQQSSESLAGRIGFIEILSILLIRSKGF